MLYFFKFLIEIFCLLRILKWALDAQKSLETKEDLFDWLKGEYFCRKPGGLCTVVTIIAWWFPDILSYTPVNYVIKFFTNYDFHLKNIYWLSASFFSSELCSFHHRKWERKNCVSLFLSLPITTRPLVSFMQAKTIKITGEHRQREKKNRIPFSQ